MEESGRRIARLAAEAAAANSPRDALRAVSELRRELDAFERRQVALALSEGATFAQIARDVGVSRQAVHRRFRELAESEAVPAINADVRRILREARDEAAALGARSLASEHVLLAALRAGDLPSAALLRTSGASFDRARALVEGSSARTPLFRRGGVSGDQPSLMVAPMAEARRRGAQRVEVEDLLIGILSDETGGAARVLRALGIDVDLVRTEIGTLRRGRRSVGGPRSP
jgi:ATP-dependent Clp protease ATP-binding subunit ClpA